MDHNKQKEMKAQICKLYKLLLRNPQLFIDLNLNALIDNDEKKICPPEEEEKLLPHKHIKKEPKLKKPKKPKKIEESQK